MIVDADFIRKVKNGELEYGKPFFDLLDDEECDYLIKYLDDNNLYIEPGKYIINQAWSAEQIIENLRFQNTEKALYFGIFKLFSRH